MSAQEVRTPAEPAPEHASPRTVQREQAARLNRGDTWVQRLRFELGEILTSGHQSSRLINASSRLEAPISTGRRIVVCGAGGGVGTTTMTALLAKLYAGLRQEPVIAIDATDQRGVLGARLGAAPSHEAASTLTLQTFVQALAAAPFNGFSETSSHAQSAGSQLWLLGQPDAPSASAGALGIEDWQKVSAALSQSFGVTVIDGGTDPLAPHLEPLLGVAHALVLLAPAGRDRMANLGRVLPALRTKAPHLGVVTATSLTGSHLTEHAHQRNGADTVVPFDRHLADGTPLRMSSLGIRTRISATELAASALAAAINPSRTTPSSSLPPEPTHTSAAGQ